MKFSKRTIGVLTNLLKHQTALVFKSGTVIRTMSESRSVFIEADLDEMMPSDVFVADGPALVSALRLFDDPDVTFEARQMIISSGSERLRFTYSDPSIQRKKMDPRILEAASSQMMISNRKVDGAIKFTLGDEVTDRIQKGMPVVGATKLAVVAEAGAVRIEAYDHNNKTGSVYTYDLGTTDVPDVRYEYDLSSWVIIPGKYDVVVEPNGNNGTSTKLFGDRIRYVIGGLKRKVDRGAR